MRRHPVILGLFLLCLVGAGILLAFSLLGGARTGGSVLSTAPRVGVVPIEGVLSASREIVESLEKMARDDGIRAVVLRIDSPGGGVVVAQEIYGAILEARKKKKVVASLQSVAASGGYLIACGADRIVANPGSITGSISTIMHLANAEELLKKIGIKSTVVKTGRYKDIGSPTREITAEERALLQAMLDDVHDQFLEAVATARKIPKEELRPIADGRVFSGRQALQWKLVDDLGDFRFAVALACKLAETEGEPELVYPSRKGGRIRDLLLQEAAGMVFGVAGAPRPGTPGAYYLLPGVTVGADRS